MAHSEHSATLWGMVLGYFACYVPYSALTKALTSGTFESVGKLPGLSLLPVSVAASLGVAAIFLIVSGWWRYAGTFQLGGWTLPRPGRWTFLSGLAASVTLLTTTLAYTFQGVSIVFAMLLMRGGVLVLAPLVDALAGRRVQALSWVALGLSLTSLAVAMWDVGNYALTLLCVVDIAAYLASYFVRLRFMSRLAKSSDVAINRRYFVEEQLVSTPAAIVLIGLLALVPGPALDPLRAGFTQVWSWPLLPLAVAVGVLSQGTGIFGPLVLLDGRENTFTVPVNRSASVVAGVVASLAMAALTGSSPPNTGELAGAGLLVAAILVLTVPTLKAVRSPGPGPAGGAAPGLPSLRS